MRALAFLFALPLWSQTAGTLECRIFDASGGAIPAARVTMKHESSGALRSALSDSQGLARLPGLLSGEHDLRVEAGGFNPVVIEELSISIGQTVVQRITMSPADVTEKLDVQAQADALQTTATAANVALGGERIEEAPAANRNYLNFVLSAPGVATSPRANTGRSAAGLRNTANDSGFVFVGVRGRNNSISIDGVDNRDETTGGNRVAVGLEIVQEFRVAGTSVGAEFGGAAGGLVNVVTRAGENVWHGDFTFFHQNENLNARNPEIDSQARPRFRRFQPGASIGGPIQRDRTFFFTAFEYSRESSQEWSEAPRLANPNWYRGLFETGERDVLFSLKASHAFSPGNSLLARYAYSRGDVRGDVQSVENFTDRSARGNSNLADYSFVGGWSRAFRGLLNDLRFQVSRRAVDVSPNSPGAMHEIPGFVTFGGSYRLDQSRTERHFEINDTAQWSLGRHFLSAGASLHAVFLDARLANRFHGVYVYPSFDRYLAGLPDVSIQAFGNPNTSLPTWPAGLWLQDRWQITPGFSLEAGLRWDLQRLPPRLGVRTNNVAPRIGFAWHPSGTSAWVVRAGAGLFYDRYPLEFLNDALQKDGVNGWEIFNGIRTTYRIAPGFHSTYSRKITAGLERKLNADTSLTAEFSDVRALHLPRIRALLPEYHLENTARSRYRGAAFSLNRRLKDDLTYLVTYALSSTRDDASDFDEHPSNPANLLLDWGRSRQHQRHRIAVSGLWDPIESWTAAPVFSWGSGRPLNTLLTSDLSGAFPFSARPPGWARNSQSAPRTVSLDLRLMKTILVEEGRARLQFGVEAFNLLNHTNRLRVSPWLTPTFAGIIEVTNPRQVQLMIQFEY